MQRGGPGSLTTPAVREFMPGHPSAFRLHPCSVAGIISGMRPVPPEQFAGFARAETVKWGDIIRRSDAKAE
jgi:hypothetical protein